MRDVLSRIAATVVIAGIGLQAMAAQPEGPRSCTFEVKSRCASGDVSVEFKAGEPVKLSVNAFWCGQPGAPGYTCTVEYTRGGDDSKWSRQGASYVIDNASPANPDRPDRMVLTIGKDISLDLENAQSSGACGAGAELPRAVVMPAGAKTCRVTLQ